MRGIIAIAIILRAGIILNEPSINQQVIPNALAGSGDFGPSVYFAASSPVSAFVSENKFVLRIMDEAVAESRNVFRIRRAKFLRGFVINELELNTAYPVTELRFYATGLL
jgi:hypothetical protein